LKTAEFRDFWTALQCSNPVPATVSVVTIRIAAESPGFIGLFAG
jgi:hypothetical protein